MPSIKITITHVDTACVILEINGFRILTDPVLDQAGKLYHFGYGSVSRKLGDPGISAEAIGEIDLVLLSHHQHQDNFDKAGRKFTKQVPLVLTTKNGAKQLDNGVGLSPWETYSIETAKLPGLKITATPGQHHPIWLPEFFSGTVTGFIIEYDNQPDGVIYITGDTVLFKGLKKIRDYTIDKVIIHLGSVRFPYLTGLGKYTMNAKDGVSLVTDIRPNQVVPIHTSGWSHFKESDSKARQTFDSSDYKDKTIWLTLGLKTELL